MSKRTEPLIRHQSAFISQHKGDGAREMSTVCLSRGGCGGVANECHREVHYGTLACCWFQNDGGSGWAARPCTMVPRCCQNREMRYLEDINEQKMQKEEKHMICNIRQFGQVQQNVLYIGNSTHFCNYVGAGVRSQGGGGSSWRRRLKNRTSCLHPFCSGTGLKSAQHSWV